MYNIEMVRTHRYMQYINTLCQMFPSEEKHSSYQISIIIMKKFCGTFFMIKMKKFIFLPFFHHAYVQ
jgi:hypothetical protein